MDEQELRNFLGGDYPSDLTYQRILKERVESFPDALEVYQPDPNGIMCNRDSWFLVSEASPPKLRLDGASIVRFSGFSLYQMTDFLLSPYGLSLSSSS